jgi:hypothetical protein
MKNKKIISRILNILLKKRFVNFIILFSILLYFSFNKAYSFCIDAKNDPNKALCSYEEIENSDKPFCDSNSIAVMEFIKTCDKKDGDGNSIINGDCEQDCNIGDCLTKQYYFIKNETNSKFDLFQRDPQPGINCQGYLPYQEEIKPYDGEVINRIIAFNYPKDYNTQDNKNPNSVSKPYCSDLDNNGNLKFINGQTQNPSNCLLKSCVHLSVEEMIKIKAASTDRVTAEDNTKTFCSINQYKINPANGLFEEAFDKLKCYNFSLNQLDYVISDVSQLNNTGYCVIHNCSPIGGSLMCDNDIQNIKTPFKNSSRNEYLNKYEEKILGNNSVDTICLQNVSSCPPLYAVHHYCIQNEDSNYVLHSECDKCVGVDNNLPNSDNCNFYEKQPQVCDRQNFTCIRTIDCGADEYKDENGSYLASYKFCDRDTTEIVDQTEDELDSWFYRPIPSERAFKDYIDKDYIRAGKREARDYVVFNRNYQGFEDTHTVSITVWPGKQEIIDYKEGLYKNTNPRDETQKICMTREDFQYFNAGCEFVPYFGTGFCKLGHFIFGFYTLLGKITSPPMCNSGMAEGRKNSPNMSDLTLCGPKSFTWLKPAADSAYIRGTPQARWSSIGPKDVMIDMEVCMRSKSFPIFSVGECGKRECSVNCIFNRCKQTCGFDRCKILTVNEKNNCALNDVSANHEEKVCMKKFIECIGKAKIHDPSVSSADIKQCYTEINNCIPQSSSFMPYLTTLNKCVETNTRSFNSIFIYDTDHCDINFYSSVSDSYDSHKSCVKQFNNFLGTPIARIRAVRKGRRVCAMLDTYNILNIDVLTAINKIRRNNINYNASRGQNYSSGRLDNYSIFDDTVKDVANYARREAEINTGKRVTVTDKLIYGESLYTSYNCDDEKNKNKEKCGSANRILGVNETFNVGPFHLGGMWVPWDIIQYIGNNQPQHDNPNCQFDREGNPIGNLSKCRGYYDQKGNFFQEQQCFIIPLSISPPKFYRMATAQNTPDLFSPILYIESVKDAKTDSFISLKDNPNVETDFFRPKLIIRLGAGLVEDGLNFAEDESSSTRTIQTIYRNETISVNYKLKKITKLYPEIRNEVCLYRLLENNEGKLIQNLVQCVKRAKPSILNFNLKASNSLHYDNSIMQASFIDLFDKNNVLNFKDSSGNINFESGQYAEASGLRIYAQKNLCARLSWDCIKNAQDLYTEKRKKENNEEHDQYKINKFTLFEENCKNVIEPECRQRNGNEREVFFENKIQIVKDHMVHGDLNESCITQGFENSLRDVIAFRHPDGILGKCLLANDSMMKKACRQTEDILVPCRANEEGCVDAGGGIYVRKIQCSCDEDGQREGYCINNVHFACLKGGINSLGILKDKDNNNIDSCVCRLADARFQATDTLRSRKETLREAGLCISIPNPPVCKAVNYQNELGKYEEGGVGSYLTEIEKKYRSNIWRTQQKRYGLIPVVIGQSDKDLEREGDYGLGHAEFVSALVGDTIFGECRGFWRKRDSGVSPQAICQNDGKFKLIQNTSCVRYKCPEIKAEDITMQSPHYNTNYILRSELDAYNKGLNAGNKKEIQENDVDIRGRFHGFANWSEKTSSDDLEKQTANSCITGFGPAGTNKYLEKHFSLGPNNYVNFTNLALLDKMNELVPYWLSHLAAHLPQRYCNQRGEWMPPRDIYNLNKQEVYYVNSKLWHTYNDEDTMVDIARINNRFCERLYCPAKKLEDIVELKKEKENTNNSINIKTFWRHMGGALWSETPAPKGKEVNSIRGICANKKSFYTYDIKFWPTFNDQLNDLKNKGNTVNLKDYQLIMTSSPQTQPTRMCTNLGLWGPIENKCVKSCEMLNMYNTAQVLDTDSSLSIVIKPDYNKFTIGEVDDRQGVTYGDNITGGAKWARSLGGETVIIEGECDASNPDAERRFVRDRGISPTRTCNTEGVWGPINNKCILIKTCGEDNMTNEVMFGLEGKLNNINNIIFWSGGNADFENIQEDSNTVIAKGVCKKEFGFIEDHIDRTCDLRTGNWYAMPDSKCRPVTCGAYTNNAVIASINKSPPSAGEYYTINTGLDASQNDTDENKYIGNGLKGAIFRSECKDNYIPVNGGVELVCELGGSDGLTPVWRPVGGKSCIMPEQCSNVSPVYGEESSDNSVYLGILKNNLISINVDSENAAEFTYFKINTCDFSPNLGLNINSLPSVNSIGNEELRTIVCYNSNIPNIKKTYICEFKNNQAIWTVAGKVCSYSNLPVLRGGDWTYADGNQGVMADMKLKGKCRSGYSSEKQLITTCGRDGTWSYPVNRCNPSNCVAQSDVQHKVCYYDNGSSSWECMSVTASLPATKHDVEIGWYGTSHAEFNNLWDYSKRTWAQRVWFRCCFGQFYTSKFYDNWRYPGWFTWYQCDHPNPIYYTSVVGMCPDEIESIYAYHKIHNPHLDPEMATGRRIIGDFTPICWSSPDT